MRTQVVTFSDAELRRQGEGRAVELRDPRYPGVRFRFTGNREAGSWFLIHRRQWRRVGGYPELGTRAALEAIRATRARLAVDPDAVIGKGHWHTLGELLTWYHDRIKTNRNISSKRRDSVLSILSLHLIPRLGDLLLAEVDVEQVDALLMWPLQQRYSVGHLRHIFRVLVMALEQALELEMIEANPLAGMRFRRFVKARSKPRPARLHSMGVESLLKLLGQHFERAPGEAMLALMMLVHGSRIGETRLARKRHVSLRERLWLLPAENTKTGTEHVLPLTDQVVALLERYFERTGGQGDGFLVVDHDGLPFSARQASEVFSTLGGGEWTSHDLRKLARTGWADLGVDYLIGEMLLNHAMGFSAETYINTSADDLKLAALQRWHAWLDERGFDAIHGATDARRAVSTGPQKPSNHAPYSANPDSSR